MYNTSNVLYALVYKRVLSRCLKLSVLSTRSRKSSLSEFQAAGPDTANARRPYMLRLCPTVILHLFFAVHCNSAHGDDNVNTAA